MWTAASCVELSSFVPFSIAHSAAGWMFRKEEHPRSARHLPPPPSTSPDHAQWARVSLLDINLQFLQCDGPKTMLTVERRYLIEKLLRIQ